jgi:hypothetical protein
MSKLVIFMFDELYMVGDSARNFTIVFCGLHSFLRRVSHLAQLVTSTFMTMLEIESVAIYLSFSSPNFAMLLVVENVRKERVV